MSNLKCGCSKFLVNRVIIVGVLLTFCRRQLDRTSHRQTEPKTSKLPKHFAYKRLLITWVVQFPQKHNPAWSITQQTSAPEHSSTCTIPPAPPRKIVGLECIVGQLIIEYHCSTYSDRWIGVLTRWRWGGVVVNDPKSIMQPDATDFNYSPSSFYPVI